MKRDAKELKSIMEQAYLIYYLTLLDPNHYYKAIQSRINHPLIGDTIMEITTFFPHLKSNNFRGLGYYEDRLYDTESEIHPSEQDWKYNYLWRIRRLDDPSIHENWRNAWFIKVMNLDEMLRFKDYGDSGRSHMFPEYQYDPSNENTWWWIKKSEEEKQRILKRTLNETKESKT